MVPINYMPPNLKIKTGVDYYTYQRISIPLNGVQITSKDVTNKTINEIDKETKRYWELQ